MSNEWYIFGPRERGGIIGGIRGGQIAVGGTALVLGLVLVQAVRSPVYSAAAALAVLVLGGCATFIPLGSRNLDQWLPLVGGWAWRRLGRRTAWTSEVHLRGIVNWVGSQTWRTAPEPAAWGGVEPVQLREVPPPLRGLRIIRAATEDTRHEIGVIRDERARTWTGILAVRGQGWALKDDSDKDRDAAAWGGVLASYGLPTSPVERVQWVECTHPEERGALLRYVQEKAAVGPGNPAYDSYAGLIETSSAAAQQHEVLVALQISERRAGRAIRQASGGWDALRRRGGRRVRRQERVDEGACAVLNRELDALAARLQAAEVRVLGKLPPEAIARHVRLAYDPGSRVARRALENARGEDGVEPDNAWPRGIEERFSWLRTDSGCHATLHVSEWPRMRVGAAFLAPLLLQTRAERTVAVTMQVLGGARAAREVRSAQTAAYGDQRMRERLGFRTTVRDEREHAVAERVEEELADGHASVRFAGYVTVTAPTEEELERAVQEVEQQAAQAKLELTRLVGQQAAARTYTLPLCRGVA